MSARQIAGPAALPVSLASAITAARADGADMDAEIELAVQGFTGEAEHLMQRALIEQTWRVTLPAFPVSIKLVMPRLIAIEYVRFYDVEGIQKTLDSQDYMTDDDEPCLLMPAPGRSWPATGTRVNAVEVQYRCGYGADHATVPAQIKSYILGRIAEKYSSEMSKSSEFLIGLLDRFKVYG